MKKNILIVGGTVAVLGLGLFSNTLSANNVKPKPEKKNVIKEEIRHVKEEIKQIFAKEYSNEDLVNILAKIENDIKNNDIKSAQNKAEDISDYLDYRKMEIVKHEDKYSESNSAYSGNKILEIKYGSWINSKEIIVPLVIQHSPLSIDVAKSNIALTSFQDNEISDAEVKYISYDVGNKKAGVDLRNLLSSLKKRDSYQIRKDINNIYGDILIDHSNKISMVLKIRDHLAVAKYLLDNNQAKAAQNAIGNADSLILKLIEIKSNSPFEQRKLKELRRELKNVSRVADASYLSEWEKIPEEIENWWKK